ncbi:MAG: rhodanese-like domain-containing protein [Myxococcota bacterium]
MSLLKSLLGWMTAGPDRITADEGRQRVAEGARLVDVRTPGEFGAGHLPEATNIPVGELPGRLAELDQAQAIVLYCASGARSARAAAFLRERGFTVGDMGPMPGSWR